MPPEFRFGNYRLDAVERTLNRDGEAVSLQDLPMRLLIALVERAPALVERDELREALWPPGTHLDVDASLNTAVARVREALGDDAGDPRFVVTVPRRGYRFVAPVTAVAAPGEDETPGDGDRRDAGTRMNPWWWAGAVAVLALPILVWWGLGVSDPGRLPASGPTAGRPAGAAREHLLIARHHADRRTRDGLEKAIAAYQSALAVEPGSAEAYSGLAFSYALLGIYDYWRPREAFGPATTMAEKALELDPDSATAQLARSLVAAAGRWDWTTALDASERAIEASPGSAEAWYWRGSLLSALGRHDEAIEAMETALDLDPTSPVVNTALAWCLFRADRGDDAVTQAHRAIELFPDYYDAWDNLKWIQLTLGHEPEALEAWVRSEELLSGGGEEIRRTYGNGGLEAVHRAAIERKTARWESGRYQSPYDIALEHAALGEVDEALLWLERSHAERETDLVDLAVDPRLDPLRRSERFAAIAAQLGFETAP